LGSPARGVLKRSDKNGWIGVKSSENRAAQNNCSDFGPPAALAAREMSRPPGSSSISGHRDFGNTAQLFGLRTSGCRNSPGRPAKKYQQPGESGPGSKDSEQLFGIYPGCSSRAQAAV